MDFLEKATRKVCFPKCHLLKLFRIKITELVSIVELAVFPYVVSGIFAEIIRCDEPSEKICIFREHVRDISV